MSLGEGWDRIMKAWQCMYAIPDWRRDRVMNGNTRQLRAFLAIAFFLPMLTSEARAQSDQQGFGNASVAQAIVNNSVQRYSVSNITRSNLNRASSSLVGVPGVNQRNFLGAGGGISSRSKPFSSVTQGPTVSPYLALSAPRAAASDYYNIIRPQQQQRRENQRQQRQAIQQQRRLNQMAARAPFSTTGDENSAPTGHVAVFQSLGSYQNTGGYFPPPSRPKQRR